VYFEAATRMFFFFLQTIFVALYEGGVSVNQLKVMILIWVNSLYKAASVEANPVQTFLVLCFSLWPVLDLLDEQL